MMADETQYPAMRYHDTLPARVVANEEEDAALGAGWRAEVAKPAAPPPEGAVLGAQPPAGEESAEGQRRRR